MLCWVFPAVIWGCLHSHNQVSIFLEKQTYERGLYRYKVYVLIRPTVIGLSSLLKTCLKHCVGRTSFFIVRKDIFILKYKSPDNLERRAGMRINHSRLSLIRIGSCSKFSVIRSSRLFEVLGYSNHFSISLESSNK